MMWCESHLYRTHVSRAFCCIIGVRIWKARIRQRRNQADSWPQASGARSPHLRCFTVSRQALGKLGTSLMRFEWFGSRDNSAEGYPAYWKAKAPGLPGRGLAQLLVQRRCNKFFFAGGSHKDRMTFSYKPAGRPAFCVSKGETCQADFQRRYDSALHTLQSKNKVSSRQLLGIVVQSQRPGPAASGNLFCALAVVSPHDSNGTRRMPRHLAGGFLSNFFLGQRGVHGSSDSSYTWPTCLH